MTGKQKIYQSKSRATLFPGSSYYCEMCYDKPYYRLLKLIEQEKLRIEEEQPSDTNEIIIQVLERILERGKR